MEYRTREQWGATYDPSGRQTIPLPRSLIFVHHNVIEPTDNPNADMERTEEVDIARFGVPSYKWAIHPSGVVLEGMTNHVSPDTLGHNSDLSIMFMGNFQNDEPTDAAMAAGRELVQWLKDNGFASQDVQIYGHRDVYATACPGANLYPRIQELATSTGPSTTPPPPPPPPVPVGAIGKLDWPVLSTHTRSSYPEHTEIVQRAVGAGVDGDYYTDTAQHVEAFQHKLGLKVDGIVGRITGTAIIQAALSFNGWDTKGVDGSYGPDTTAAVEQFQRDKGIGVDGIFGLESTTALLNHIRQ